MYRKCVAIVTSSRIALMSSRNLCAINSHRILKIVLLAMVAIAAYVTWTRYKNEMGCLVLSGKIPATKGGNSRSKQIHEPSTLSPAKRKELISRQSERSRVDSDQSILQNITVDFLTGRLVREVGDDPYIQERDDYFLPQNMTDTEIDHQFVLDGRSVCQDINNSNSSPYLLILIPSIVRDESQRNAIRRTWVGAAEQNRWIKEPITKVIRHVFFLGQWTKSSEWEMESVSNESKKFGDIVQADLVDTYGNLSRKMATALQWVANYCPGVEYVLKCDQDTYVNVPLMLRFLSEVETTRKEKAFVLGRIHFGQSEVARKGRWSVSEDYRLRYFPLYAYGHTYVVSGKAIPSLVAAARRFHFVGPEDVYVTGILPKVAGVTRLHAQCFAVCCRDIFDCEVVWNHYVSMTSANRPWDHYRLWKSVQRGECHPFTLFNYHLRKKKFGVYSPHNIMN